jgi:hypothetical protein
LSAGGPGRRRESAGALSFATGARRAERAPQGVGGFRWSSTRLAFPAERSSAFGATSSRVVEIRLAARADRHARPLVRERERDGSPDAAAPPGHDPNLACELQIHARYLTRIAHRAKERIR